MYTDVCFLFQTDDEIMKGMRFAFERMKLVVEAASGAGIAAAMSERLRQMDAALRHVGVILCGGNTDIDRLPCYLILIRQLYY
ncbi:SRR-like protein [Mya arenaria]|uniref:SRR-like protein n=1 Tax=Mya arenaria TaxID=6604 RepID=A0ABY7E102_MYAAR|nr:SRR-like protein [Mya arenaria]